MVGRFGMFLALVVVAAACSAGGGTNSAANGSATSTLADSGSPTPVDTEPHGETGLDARFAPEPDLPRLMSLSGDITKDGTFVLSDIRKYLGPFRPELLTEPAQTSRAEVVGFDEDGTEVFRQPVSVGVVYGDVVEREPWRPGLEGSVRVQFPGVDSLRRVAVELDGEEVWSQAASIAAPTATVDVEGTVVRWNVEDDDSRAVNVVVYFFGDDEEVDVIQTSFDTEGVVDLNDARLDAADNGTVVVWATDGFNGTVAGVDSVAVDQSPPTLYLDWPEEGLVRGSTSWLALDVTVSVAGRSCVGSCETPDGHEVIWYSDVDGEIGRGASLEIFPDANGGLPLTIGSHTITVVVEDDHGNAAEVQGQLTITE